ncbi:MULTISPECIES: hypothetical protein [unclassified Methylophilus]|uniref:hypothetical protein n=1 Tax=unclassified Methylophilus TaxID=2630143 RepID=UPI0006FEAFEC|nr:MULTISPECIES: hypothetical protein [unclassified Methylophilus]KQT42240.1 prolyl-tRNA synthetase [Methylophilus sp. Leaf416]KQT56422.1 prolyl-tRNA synthetase [Methylophilus sp. Leaf459]
MQLNKKLLSGLALLCLSLISQAEILPEAEVGIKIPLSKKPTTRPMTVAYLPGNQHYYIADGGLAPMGSEFEAPISKSEVHAYTANGQYVNSAKPGFDNRSLYYNANSNKLETITYNISTAAGFSPNTGIFSLDVDDKGEVLTSSNELYQFNPAFGDAGTMPSYDPATNHYYAKQEHGNLVFVVDAKQREKLKEIKLDYSKAQVVYDDVSDHYVAFTGVAGNELALLDVDHKAVLIFDLNGQYVGKSALPKTMKLRSHNHFNGAGYSNGMLFVYHENEGEFGTYYGFKVVK